MVKWEKWLSEMERKWFKNWIARSPNNSSQLNQPTPPLERPRVVVLRATVKRTLFWPLDGELAVGSHWVAMSEEPTKPKSSRSIWIIIAIIALVVIAFVVWANTWLTILPPSHYPSRHTWVAIPALRQPECLYPFSLFLKISSSHLIRDGLASGKNLDSPK